MRKLIYRDKGEGLTYRIFLKERDWRGLLARFDVDKAKCSLNGDSYRISRGCILCRDYDCETCPVGKHNIHCGDVIFQVSKGMVCWEKSVCISPYGLGWRATYHDQVREGLALIHRTLLALPRMSKRECREDGYKC